MPPKTPCPSTVCPAPASALWPSLGGSANVRTLEAVALTRLRVELIDPARLDEPAARQAGAHGVMHVSPTVVHVIVGDGAVQFAAALQQSR